MKNEAPRPGAPVRGSKTGRPLMATLDLLGRRGALRILWELRAGQSLTFRALSAAAELPPATLNTRLHELREVGVIELEQGYKLSTLGCELIVALASLQVWSERWARALRHAP